MHRVRRLSTPRAGSSCWRRRAGARRTAVHVQSLAELRDGGRHLEAHVQDAALALEADVARPLDEAREVAARLQVAHAEVLLLGLRRGGRQRCTSRRVRAHNPSGASACTQDCTHSPALHPGNCGQLYGAELRARGARHAARAAHGGYLRDGGGGGGVRVRTVNMELVSSFLMAERAPLGSAAVFLPFPRFEGGCGGG